jgi:hypothetical protein
MGFPLLVSSVMKSFIVWTGVGIVTESIDLLCEMTLLGARQFCGTRRKNVIGR